MAILKLQEMGSDWSIERLSAMLNLGSELISRDGFEIR